jgi:hypothetical protein
MRLPLGCAGPFPQPSAAGSPFEARVAHRPLFSHSCLPLHKKCEIPKYAGSGGLFVPLHKKSDILIDSKIIPLQPASVSESAPPPPGYQLATRARGTKERARLGWLYFGREIFILKTMKFREITTVLNERKHLEIAIRSVSDSVSLIFGRTEWAGLTALHRAKQLYNFSCLAVERVSNAGATSCRVWPFAAESGRLGPAPPAPGG